MAWRAPVHYAVDGVASTGTFGHIERLVPETPRYDVAEG